MDIDRNDIQWSLKPFNSLDVEEVYAILQLRSAVFVVEQNCVFQDMDGKDKYCLHLSGYQDGSLIAYTRIVPPGISYSQPSIGRVVVKQSERHTGLGTLLMQKSIDHCHALFGNTDIKIGAQLYLKSFYGRLGFLQTSEVYDEDGIDHIEMTKASN